MTEGRAVDGGAASDRAAAGRLSTEDRQRASCWRRAADGGPAARRPQAEGGRAVDGWKGACTRARARVRAVLAARPDQTINVIIIFLNIIQFDSIYQS